VTDDHPLLSAERIGRRVRSGKQWLLDNVSVAIFSGQRLALVGPSGAGKTLLLRSLAMLDPLDTGQVRWMGGPVHRGDVPEFRSRVVYLHQRPPLSDGAVEAILRQPFDLKTHRRKRFDMGQVNDYLDSLGRDTSFLTKQSRDLSGGECQIVMLIRVLQLNPQILLLDEPTAALDPPTARRAEELISLWVQEDPSQRAVVWASHTTDQVEWISEEILRLEGGRLASRSRQ
jgi:putative ABC transport system ATP-binding protein